MGNQFNNTIILWKRETWVGNGFQIVDQDEGGAGRPRQWHLAANIEAKCWGWPLSLEVWSYVELLGKRNGRETERPWRDRSWETKWSRRDRSCDLPEMGRRGWLLDGQIGLCWGKLQIETAKSGPETWRVVLFPVLNLWLVNCTWFCDAKLAEVDQATIRIEIHKTTVHPLEVIPWI